MVSDRIGGSRPLPARHRCRANSQKISSGERCDVNRNTGAHRGADRNLLHIHALRTGRLRLDDGVGECTGILQQLRLIKARLADAGDRKSVV